MSAVVSSFLNGAFKEYDYQYFVFYSNGTVHKNKASHTNRDRFIDMTEHSQFSHHDTFIT